MKYKVYLVSYHLDRCITNADHTTRFEPWTFNLEGVIELEAILICHILIALSLVLTIPDLYPRPYLEVEVKSPNWVGVSTY